MASDEFLRRPRERMCPAGSGFGQFERWEWIWTLLKRSRCMVRFPHLFIFVATDLLANLMLLIDFQCVLNTVIQIQTLPLDV